MVASHFSYETAYRPGLSFLFLLFSALRPLGLIVPHSSTTLSPVFLGTTPPHQYLLCQQSSGKGDVALPPQAAPQPITVPSVSWAVEGLSSRSCGCKCSALIVPVSFLYPSLTVEPIHIYLFCSWEEVNDICNVRAVVFCCLGLPMHIPYLWGHRGSRESL